MQKEIDPPLVENLSYAPRVSNGWRRELLSRRDEGTHVGIQLQLPATWAYGQSLRDPRERLSALQQDVLDAKAAIRVALEQLAEKHHISMREVDSSMGWADDGLADLVYQTENDLVHEIEEQDPV